MEEEDVFYQNDDLHTNSNDSNIKNEKNNEHSEYNDDCLIHASIELLISYQDYCKDEGIPLAEFITSNDIFEFIKYGYN